MKGQLQVTTPEQYIASLEEPRRTDVARLDRLIREVAPQLDPFILGGVLAYGPVHYRYATGREGDAARIAIASNASAISLYVLAEDESGWVLARYRDKLGKANIGKSCIRIKRLDDLDFDTLKQLLREAGESAFPAHGGIAEDRPVSGASTASKAAKTARKTTRKATPRKGRTSKRAAK